jgi:pimeloyl-ACP methyl ester carboxylesterase
MIFFRRNNAGKAFKTSGLIWILILLVFSHAAQATTGISPDGLSYETAGKGRTIVLIHGGLVDRRMWDAQFKKFAEKYRVIRYDLRGFGKSQFPTAPYSHVEDLYNLLKFLKIERAAVLGLSLGGTIAIDFALEHPEMVEALILAGSAIRGYKYVPVGDRSAIFQAAGKKEVEKAVALWLADPVFSTAQNRPAAFASMRAMLTDNFKAWSSIPPELTKWPAYSSIERLAEIKAPALVLVGDRDNANILGIADILAAKIVRAQKIVYRETGHHLNLERPGKFNKNVLKFLKKVLS